MNLFCFIGLNGAELAILGIVYLGFLTYTFYYLVNEQQIWWLKLSKLALAIFLPVIGMILIWGEVLMRRVIFKHN